MHMRQSVRLILSILLIVFIHQAQATDLKSRKPLSADGLITAKITAQFAKKTGLDASKIFVSTEKGIVKLNGEVKNKQAFVDAFWLARTTRGVKMVDVDDLEIKRINTTLKDAYITAKIETSVLKAKILDDESIPLVGINATTSNGIVTLTGDVKRDKSINAILKRANAVHGVKKIISLLRVGSADI
jgi:hyperosmotically inducible protein